jgi:bifunctional non-homologous end joining protein LigD
VILGPGGVAEFDALHCGKRNAEVRLVAFDLLAAGGDDIRSDSLLARKARLAKMLTKACDGIQYNEHMEGEIGVAMFEHACKLGLEAIVSKHRDRAYRAGRSVNQLGQGQEPSFACDSAG